MKGSKTITIEMDGEESKRIYVLLSKLTKEDVVKMMCSCVEGDATYKVLEKLIVLL